jgi:SAM-dependent methyltransferase
VREVFADERLWELEDRYRGRFQISPVSYGTVPDLADSLDNLGGLARASADMKDLQRCWMVKAILGSVPAGGRLVEIGAGEPLVADLLSRLGYEVTVVDPYDGSGYGPREFGLFRRSYPHLEFIRERFPPGAELPSDIACIYSISVLEHVPVEAVDELIGAAHDALAPGGSSLHAVDHVVAGWGGEAHLERLRRIVAACGLPIESLEAVIEQLRGDPETYFVSAEAHERWRGDLAYDKYPMRRIVSVNVCSRRPAGS